MLHLGAIVLGQEAVTRAEVVHLQSELVITRTLKLIIKNKNYVDNNNNKCTHLRPEQPQTGLGDLGH